MAAKDSNNKSKTSKTAHVMSLLSKKQDPAAPAGEPEEAAAAPAAAPVPPILSSLGADAAVSVQIKNALEDALEEDLRGEAEVPAQPAAVEPAPVRDEPSAPAGPSALPEAAVQPEPPAPSVPAAPPEPVYPAQSEPVQAAPAPAAPVPQTAAAPVPPPAPAFQTAASIQQLVPEHPGYVNVMQVLVEEKALKYAELFGLCTCDRCMADVKALTLNHLPAKYVVMGQNEMIPKITFYEGKYSSEITAQLLHACDLVYKTPHHDR